MIAAADFAGWFQSVHGHAPFDWQSRLSCEVIDTGWPDVIAAPTGAGKTAVLDIALFHLALRAGHVDRAAPLRIVYAVDRRVVVDQAFARAQDLRKAVARDGDPVGAALRRFGDAPLHVEQLRGGLPREDDWARAPAQPTILCTTIDQLGSRLLFRGYGVSERMAPVHAGLLGEDALLILDEAHLSGAFAQTLAGVGALRGGKLGRPWAVTVLTATPRDGGARVFRLSEAERAEKAIAARLNAAKSAALVSYKGKAGDDGHIACLVEQALAAAKCATLDPVVAVVVNRVALARAVYAALATDGEAILLTGRSRPAERDALVRRYWQRLRAGRTEAANAPLFVVATQCIEAGADFDFDALVTQLAPLDALRQRFGRLDRLGERPGARAAIVAADDEIRAKADDPLYGDRATATWQWLNRVAADGAVDFGPAALDALNAPADLGAPPGAAPLLRRADVDFFAMTSPRPNPDPYLPLFLRGAVEAQTDVQLIWRADLGDDEGRWADIVAAMPPRLGEALAVPIWAAKRWLRAGGALAAEVADADMRKAGDEGGGEGRTALRWRGRNDAGTKPVSAGDICPGDTLVVPVGRGGCDRFGWDPTSGTEVADIADLALAPYARRAAALRVHPALWPSGADAPAWRGGESAVLLAEEVRGPRALFQRLTDATDDLPPDWVAGLDRLEMLCKAGARLDVAWPYDADGAETAKGFVLSARLARGRAITDGDDAGSFLARSQGLAEHAAEVEAQARAFATAAGLTGDLVATLALAGKLHDDGKADPRFQKLLGGSAAVPLAKSGRREAPGARAASGVPDGWRHEALSVRLAIPVLDTASDDIDAELALWLVGTHHGYGRPFFGVHHDAWDASSRTLNGAALLAGVGPERLDFDWRGHDWPGLFAALTARYGTWGLAYLEAVLRLADHRASEAAERGPA